MPIRLPFWFATHFCSANHNIRKVKGAGDGNVLCFCSYRKYTEPGRICHLERLEVNRPTGVILSSSASVCQPPPSIHVSHLINRSCRDFQEDVRRHHPEGH